MPETAIHGSNAILYLSPGTGAAIPVAEQVDYSIELDKDIQVVTALGRDWGRKVAGANEWSGSASGNFNPSDKTLWLAGTSKLSQRFYLYPDRTVPAQYYYGMAFVKLGKAIDGGMKKKASSSFSLEGTDELGLN